LKQQGGLSSQHTSKEGVVGIRRYFMVLLLAATFFLSFSASQSLAAERVYRMSGEITAIDIAHNTVVVEVPLGDRLFTIGGPLSSDAIVNKGGKLVGLADSRRGDRVTVKWKVTEHGHVILMLESH
jgi:hypothetical protein